MKKHYETHVEDTDKLISVAGPVLDYTKDTSLLMGWMIKFRALVLQ